MTEKRTKIVCTMGPATESDEVLRELIKAGMNVARFNFSHGSHAYHRNNIDRVRRISEELGKPVGSDVENSKSTYVSLLGIERCRELVDELTQQALEALGAFSADTTELIKFALDLAKRTN